MRDYWGEPSGEPRPDYRDAVEPDVPIEHEGKPARGERAERPADDGYRTDVPDLLGTLTGVQPGTHPTNTTLAARPSPQPSQSIDRNYG